MLRKSAGGRQGSAPRARAARAHAGPSMAPFAPTADHQVLGRPWFQFHVRDLWPGRQAEDPRLFASDRMDGGCWPPECLAIVDRPAGPERRQGEQHLLWRAERHHDRGQGSGEGRHATMRKRLIAYDAGIRLMLGQQCHCRVFPCGSRCTDPHAAPNDFFHEYADQAIVWTQSSSYEGGW